MSAFDFEENPDEYEYEYVYETINAASSSGSNSSTTVAPASDFGFSFSIDHLDYLCPAEEVRATVVDGPAEIFGASKKGNTAEASTMTDGSHCSNPAEMFGASKIENTAEVSTMTDESICLFQTADFMRGSADAHVHLSSERIYASSAEDLKSRAFSETVSSLKVNAQSGIYAFQFLQLNSLIFKVRRCGQNCPFGRNCVKSVKVGDVLVIRESFWGDCNMKAGPSPTAREKLLREWFQGSYLNVDGTLVFPCKQSDHEEVCEQGLYHLLGYQSESSFSRQWKKIKSERMIVLDPQSKEKYSAVLDKKTDTIEKMSYAVVLEQVKAYIQVKAESTADTVPHGDVGTDILIMPFLTVQEFYNICYVPDMLDRDDDPCSITYFNQAFKELSNIRLLRSKGSFNTCGICNKSDDLINNNGYTRAQKEIFKSYRFKHIKQQQRERQELDKSIERAKSYDIYGNTKAAVLYSDGMTVMTGDTPKRHGENTDATITNRVIGVLAVCGPIESTFIYNLDDFVPGGANTMIEIMRQGDLCSMKFMIAYIAVVIFYYCLYVRCFVATKDLMTLLVQKGMNKPPKMIYQFDNCGENKVIYT